MQVPQRKGAAPEGSPPEYYTQIGVELQGGRALPAPQPGVIAARALRTKPGGKAEWGDHWTMRVGVISTMAAIEFATRQCLEDSLSRFCTSSSNSCEGMTMVGKITMRVNR